MAGSRFGLLLIAVLLLQSACSRNERVEPLLLEPERVVGRVVADFPDGEKVAAARSTLISFVQALAQDNCEAAWALLSTGFRSRFSGVAGGDSQARDEFCQGRCPAKEGLVKCDWRRVMSGADPAFVVSAPPELTLDAGAAAKVYFAVQRDGSSVSFLLVQEGQDARLEPLL